MPVTEIRSVAEERRVPPVAVVSSQLFPRRFRKSVLVFPGIAAACGIAMIPFCNMIYFTLYRTAHVIPDGFYSTTVQFASGTAMAAIAMAVFLVDVPRRRTVIYFLAALAFAGIVNESVKQVTGRNRPYYTMRRTIPIADPATGTVNYTFAGDTWLWLTPGRSFLKDEYCSFPSGHACAAFITAAYLTRLYSRGRALWLFLAVGCCLARVRLRRHFPEDVLVGGAWGWVAAHIAFSWAWPGKVADFLAQTFSRRGKVG